MNDLQGLMLTDSSPDLVNIGKPTVCNKAMAHDGRTPQKIQTHHTKPRGLASKSPKHLEESSGACSLRLRTFKLSGNFVFIFIDISYKKSGVSGVGRHPDNANGICKDKNSCRITYDCRMRFFTEN